MFPAGPRGRTSAPFGPFAGGGGFALGKWNGTGLLFFFSARSFLAISGLPAPVTVAAAASNAATAPASSPFSSSATPRRKCAFSQSGRSATHASASASAWLTLLSFRNDALRLL